MDSQKNLLQKAVEILQKSSSGAICLPQNPSPDAIAAALALYLGLTRMGKNVTIACSTPIKSELMAADKIGSTIATSGNDLVVSLPYTDGSIDKVSYYTEGNSLNIVIVPGADHPKLEQKQVKFSYTGGAVDFVITVDVDNLKRLGEIYSENQTLFVKNKVINIDRHLTNSFFGAVNLVYRTASSTSEIILAFLQTIKCPIDRDMATNLYQGMAAATKNFSSYSVTAQTFENAANLLKLGAKKRLSSSSNGSFPRQFGPEFEKQSKAIEDGEKEIVSEDATLTDEDFLKPKIFKPGTGENV